MKSSVGDGDKTLAVGAALAEMKIRGVVEGDGPEKSWGMCVG